MDDIAKFFNSILDRIKDFFEVIDLSMIIAGTLAVLIVYWWQFLNKYSFDILYLKEYVLLLHVIIAYGFGLIAFSVGRSFRRVFLKYLTHTGDSNYYLNKIKEHKLKKDANIKRYLPLTNESRRSLREFLWSDIRQNDAYGYSKSFLNKYWSMSVIFDSLFGVSFLFDLVFADLIFGFYGKYTIKEQYSPELIISLVLLSFLLKACLVRMANVYDEYQDDELLSSYTALKRRRKNFNCP